MIPARLILLAMLGLTGSPAMACRSPGHVWPSTTELATTSDLVFIAHVEHVRPLSKSDEEFLRNELPVGVPFIFPTALADFSVVRNLKGSAPVPALLQSATQNCSGVFLEDGGDYLIFANQPERAGGEIAPIKGSFKLSGSTYTQAELRKIEAHLHIQTSAKP